MIVFCRGDLHLAKGLLAPREGRLLLVGHWHLEEAQRLEELVGRRLHLERCFGLLAEST